MVKLVISVLALSVVTCVVGFSLRFETHTGDGRLTTWGLAAAALTVISFGLGVATEIYSYLEKRRDEEQAAAKHLEQREQLKRIESEVKASSRPLLPVVLFYTLRFQITDTVAERVFRDVKGYRTANTEFLRPIGSGSIGGDFRRNFIEFETQHSHCVLEGDQLHRTLEAHHAFMDGVPYRANIDFFLNGHSEWPTTPTITLEHDLISTVPHEITRLELFDNVIFRDDVLNTWKSQSAAGKFGIDDLPGARIRVRLTTLGERGSVSFHNLHLYFGPDSSRVGFALPLDLLQSATFEPLEDQLFHFGDEHARKMFVEQCLEITIDCSTKFVREHFARIVQ